MTKIFLIDAKTSKETAKKALPVGGADVISFPFESEKKMLNNFAPFERGFTKLGSPVFNAQFVSLKGLSSYLQTSATDCEEFTLFAVVRSSDLMTESSNRPVYFGNYQSVPLDGSSIAVTYGVALYSSAVNAMTIAAGRGTSVDNDSSANVTVPCDSKNFQLFCVKVTEQRTQIANVTTGETVGSNQNQPRYLAAAPMRIGSGYTSFGGLNDIAAIVRYKRALDQQEIDDVSGFIKNYLLKYGVAV